MQVANDTLTRPEETIVFLAYPQDVNYKYMKLLCTVQPGIAVSPHKHPKVTETFRLITDATVEIVIAGKAQQLRANQDNATTVLAGVVHEWVNDTNQPLTFEVVFFPIGGHSLQEINIVGAFTSYFALMNDCHKSSRLAHQLTMAIKCAMSEYAFRDFSVSVSIVTRVKVFLFAQLGRLLGLKPYLGET